jgi:hypothetical protein
MIKCFYYQENRYCIIDDTIYLLSSPIRVTLADVMYVVKMSSVTCSDFPVGFRISRKLLEFLKIFAALVRDITMDS